MICNCKNEKRTKAVAKLAAKSCAG